jgi:hypothetical protein
MNFLGYYQSMRRNVICANHITQEIRIIIERQLLLQRQLPYECQHGLDGR